MPGDVISAHSVAEAFLYVLVTPCPICKCGARQASKSAPAGDGGVISIVATCDNCGGTEECFFEAPGPLPAVDPLSDSAPINPTAEPSELIDVAQWVTLYQLMLESAEETPDRQERRWRRFRAAQCLDEALKLYAPDSDVPPESAFFTDSSRSAFRDHPQRFARERLLDLRAKLPDVEAEAKVTRQVEQVGSKRPWWRFW